MSTTVLTEVSGELKGCQDGPFFLVDTHVYVPSFVLLVKKRSLTLRLTLRYFTIILRVFTLITVNS